jgi:AbrB family looped-hinge helix DNA binding protein
MTTTIDEAGRIVIPRDLRRAAGLEPGLPLEVYVQDGAVVIEPAPTPVVIERRGRFAVARPKTPGPKLSTETVEKTRSQVHAERGATRGKNA